MNKIRFIQFVCVVVGIVSLILGVVNDELYRIETDLILMTNPYYVFAADLFFIACLVQCFEREEE